MNGHSDPEPAAGLEPINAGDAIYHGERSRLAGRITRLLEEALTEGFGSGEAHIARLREAHELGKGLAALEEAERADKGQRRGQGLGPQNGGTA